MAATLQRLTEREADDANQVHEGRRVGRDGSGRNAGCRRRAGGAQDRDLNGDTVTDAFYDTDLNITWLRDANLNGSMNWATAVSWADNLSFGGYTDWRLPNTTGSCTGYDCTSSGQLRRGHDKHRRVSKPVACELLVR